MHIFFTRFPLESVHGGAENQTTWLWEGLKERGHTLQFLGDCPVLIERAKKLHIAHCTLQMGPPPVTKWNVVSFLWRKKTMQERLIQTTEKLIAQSAKPTAIMMLSLSEKLLLTEWAHDQGIKVFWIEHDRIGPWLSKNPWLPALKKVSHQATIVCVSELSRKMYVDMGFDPERVVAIPNGVPPSPLTPLPEGEGNSPSPPGRRGRGMRVGLRIGCIARLSEEKGIDILLQAIAEMPEVTLKIVGKGPQEGYLRSLIAEDTRRLGIGVPRMTLESSVPDLDVFYASLDALVLPSSDHDPFGLVAAEAMVRGIPTVVTDACGIAGYLEKDREALIAEAGSPESLTMEIKKLASPELRNRLSEVGKKTVSERFSLSRMVGDYEAIIQHDFR